jgi:hypothetical protein
MTTKLIALVLGFWPIAHVWADPPVLLRIVRNARDAESRQIYARAGTAVDVLGMRAVSGLDEAWLMEMHDSFASIEGVDQALASVRPTRNSQGSAYPAPDEVLGPARLLIALYRPGLSYRADEAAKSLPRARYLLVSIYRTRPEDETAFAGIVKLRRAVNDSVNLNRPEIAYEVVAGTVSGTYVFVTPLATLKNLDDGLSRTPAYAEGARNESKKAAAETEINHERVLLRIDPGLSYVSEEFASGDTEFWKPK